MENKKVKTELLDNFEDAWFAILMDDYAYTEGKRLIDENERLKGDPTFVVPDSFEQCGRRAIKRAFAAKKRMKAKKYAFKLLSRVSVFALVIVMMFTITFFTVEAFRTRVMNMLLDIQETHTEVRFTENSTNPNTTPQLESQPNSDLPSWVPDGYILSAFESSLGLVNAQYTNNEGNTIDFHISDISGTTNVDTEDVDEVAKVKIGNYDGLVVSKDSCLIVVWGDTIRGKTLQISAQYIDKESLLKMAASVKG